MANSLYFKTQVDRFFESVIWSKFEHIIYIFRPNISNNHSIYSDKV